MYHIHWMLYISHCWISSVIWSITIIPFDYWHAMVYTVCAHPMLPKRIFKWNKNYLCFFIRYVLYQFNQSAFENKYFVVITDGSHIYFFSILNQRYLPNYESASIPQCMAVLHLFVFSYTLYDCGISFVWLVDPCPWPDAND